jgi:putative phage-type endonuclease
MTNLDLTPGARTDAAQPSGDGSLELAGVGGGTSMSPLERRRYIGSSEIASLFGLGRVSRFELWHRKAGNLPEEDISGLDRVFWGTTLEPAIAKGAAEREEWSIRKAGFFVHPSIPGMACHPDYEIEDVGLLEVKNVDALIFREWADEIPPHIELQLQHQLACTGRTWGAFAILVGGNQLHVIRREARPVTMRKLGEAVIEFWESIEAGREPEPEWECDLPTLSKLYGHAEAGKVLDLRDHSQANALAAEYCAARDAEKAAKARREAIKAHLLPIIGNAERVTLRDGYSISAKSIAGGHVEFDREPHRDFRITQNKRFALVAKKNGGE